MRPNQVKMIVLGQRQTSLDKPLLAEWAEDQVRGRIPAGAVTAVRADRECYIQY